MVVKQGKCKICNEFFKANGEDKFSDILLYHFSVIHKEEWQRLKILCNNADKELYKLKGKYPELHLWFGSFSINKAKVMYNEIE